MKENIYLVCEIADSYGISLKKARRLNQDEKENGAFKDLYRLTEINISDKLISIGANAFYN